MDSKRAWSKYYLLHCKRCYRHYFAWMRKVQQQGHKQEVLVGDLAALMAGQ
eukprot:XP_001706602.1 Hypothetical protein GL50803_36106 [Giardia lamblia ATCC 50803]